MQSALLAADLSERADDRVATYSLGMRQRLGIAAALLRDPDVVVLDEPTNGLDPAGIAEIRELMIGLAGQGRTVVVSSHLLDEVQRVCDRVAVVAAGRCIATGPIDDVLATADAGRLLVGVNDPVAAQRALAAAGIDALIADGILRVTWPAEHAARISEILAASGCYVDLLQYERPTLEAVYLALTSPGGAA